MQLCIELSQAHFSAAVRQVPRGADMVCGTLEGPSATGPRVPTAAGLQGPGHVPAAAPSSSPHGGPPPPPPRPLSKHPPAPPSASRRALL